MKDERNWPYIGPSMGHWNVAGKLRVAGQGRKEGTNRGRLLSREEQSGHLLLWWGVLHLSRQWMSGFCDQLRQRPSLPVHVVRMQLNLSGIRDHLVHVSGFGG